MCRKLVAILGLVLVTGFMSLPSPAAEDKDVGKKVQEGVEKVAEELKEGWASLRRTIERMGVESRVYARLRWDKALASATLDVEVNPEKAVVLKGSVANAAAKQKAVQLARDTVGVTSVIDELAVPNQVN